MNVVCNRCNARRFPGESKGFCCNDGKVQLALPPPLPQHLKDYMNTTSFKKNVRAFNQAFAFTSLGCTNIDQRVAGNGVYNFSNSRRQTRCWTKSAHTTP